MAENTSKILDRIAKLMRMADGGTKHEAEVAAKMAQSLLLKHNLSMSDVNNNIDESERAIMDELFNMRDTWKKVEGNCMQLIPRLREAEKQEWSWYNGFDNRNVFKRGFFQGAVAGINQQLSEALDKMRDEDKNINGLVLYNDKAVTEYRDKKWPNLGKGRGSRSNSTMGGMLGNGITTRRYVNMSYSNLQFASVNTLRSTDHKELIDGIKTQFQYNSDTVDFSQLNIKDDGTLCWQTDDGKNKEASMTEPAFKALCRRLHIPDPFAKQINWDLLKHNITELSANSDKQCQVFTRKDDGAVVNVAHDMFIPLDHELFLNHIQKNSPNIKRALLSDNLLELDITQPRFGDMNYKDLEIEKGDIIESGVTGWT